MRPSFRYLAALSVVLSVYLVYLNVNHINETWHRIPWVTRKPSGNGIGFPQGKPGTDAGISPVTPPPAPSSKVVVIAKLAKEDTNWVAENLPDWQNVIYTVDNTSATFHTTQNKGREGNAYLTYLIEHYDALPDIMVFLHAHRGGYPEAWHNDFEGYDNVKSVQSLKLDHVQKQGYANLRCVAIPGCPDDIQPFRDPPHEHRDIEHIWGKAWGEIFGKDVEVPRVIATPCCAQFAVSKQEVMKRPKSDYEHLHNWLMTTELPDQLSGRVLEYMWHILFGQAPVFCPNLWQCYCDVYGHSCEKVGTPVP